MSWLTGQWSQVGEVAAKAVLMYAVALVGLRVGERRTLAQWTLIDVITAVALGAVVGRTTVASTQSLVTGAVALLVLVAVHRVASVVRFSPAGSRLLDHRVRVLVLHGEIRRRQLRLCGLTDEDLWSQLRQRGVLELSGIAYVLYEAKGTLSIVPATAVSGGLPLGLRRGLEGAAAYDLPAPADGPV